MNTKLSPDLLEMVQNQSVLDPLSVIIMVKGEGEGQDRLNDEDRQMIATVGGQIEEDLWIIKGFSARIPAKALEAVVLSPRVNQVHHNSDVAGVSE